MGKTYVSNSVHNQKILITQIYHGKNIVEIIVK